MDQDKKIEERISQFQALGKEDKNVDVAKLMMYSLDQKRNFLSAKRKYWSYIISLSLPPVGFLIALKYYFDEEEDARHVANICIILTLIALLLTWVSLKMIFSGTGTDLNQIQQINPKDIEDLMK
ncbi:MAG: hypothetical protein WC858_05990 [Parcubacteria group bacterium]|jgi:hypothetical protein